MLNTQKVLISLYHCGYIFLLDSSAQDTSSFSFLLTKHGQGNRGVLKNKNQNKNKKGDLKVTPQFELRREDLNA